MAYKIIQGTDKAKVEKQVEKWTDKDFFLASPLMVVYNGSKVCYVQAMNKPTKKQQEAMDGQSAENLHVTVQEAILAFLQAQDNVDRDSMIETQRKIMGIE